MPGARPEATLLADKEISSLNKEGIMVVWVGANDINRTERIIRLKHIRNFALNCIHTNIIVMTAPYRHNLHE
jgi:hypothetical protein